MNKPLNDNRNVDDAAKGSEETLQAANLGAYAQNATYNAALSEKAWGNGRKAFNETPGGRLAIRTFSRGVMGAAFFAAGGMLTKKWMNPDEVNHAIDSTLTRYDSAKPFSEQSNPLQFIAKIIDTVVGKPIELTVGAIGGKTIGKRAVTFRPTTGGRTLGHEAVSITFDFFCASVGDAWGRDIAGWVDPAVEKKWYKDGKFNLPEAVKQVGKSAWQYVSYNGGEDWAVAIPYAYFMKAHRGILNHEKISPGYGIDFDAGKNGGTYRLKDNGTPNGTFALEASIDLQHRFVVYNMGTLAFREAYDYAARRLQGKQANLYGAPDDESRHQKGIIGKAVDTAKWLVRSVVKGGIYMTPAVPTFWITRSTQFRLPLGDPKVKFLGSKEQDVRLSKESIAAFSPYHTGDHVIDRGFDQIARFNDAAVGMVQNHAEVLDGWSKGRLSDFSKRALGGDVKDFAKRHVNAAVAYTPYMYSKAEFARLWDTGRMDMATERMIDGAFSFRPGEFKAGAKEVWRAFTFEPMDDLAREAEAKRRTELDTSLPADVNLEDERFMKRKAKEAHKPDWRERIIHGNGRSKNDDQEKNSNIGFRQQEEMRKALRDLDPPTNSVH